MNIPITHSKNNPVSSGSCPLPFGEMFEPKRTTLSRTIRQNHFQEQDLVSLQTTAGDSSAFFQKRERSLKNPSYSILALDSSITVSITDDVVSVSRGNRANETDLTDLQKRTDRISSGNSKQKNSGGESIERMPLSGCPFELLSTILEAQTNAIDSQSLPTEIAFASGMIGYLGFGITSRIENVEKQTHNPLNVPDSMMMLPQTIIYIDHHNKSIHLLSRSGADRFQSLLEQVERLNDNASRTQNRRDVSDSGFLSRKVSTKTTNRSVKSFESNERSLTTPASTISIDRAELTASMSKQEFLAKAHTAKQFIEEGQCFQIVLSQRFSTTTSVSAAELFSTLLETAPSTYNYFLNFPNFQYIGASPETMISAKAGQVRLCALAGTRPRGTTPAQDDHNEVELKTNEKELAEHLMLVDLGRNDLGKVCAPGSIQVGPIAQVLKYSNVMHLGTEIFGTLESDKTSFTALKACFPRGTVSGAPKVRALELLSKLEPEQRGIYAGAVGFFDGRGNMDTAIAIRSALLKDGSIHINAGAGIVYDSDPEFEYMETINKASAIANVFQQVKTILQTEEAGSSSEAEATSLNDNECQSYLVDNDNEANYSNQVHNIRAGAR